jgi:hypothetical protein
VIPIVITPTLEVAATEVVDVRIRILGVHQEVDIDLTHLVVVVSVSKEEVDLNLLYLIIAQEDAIHLVMTAIMLVEVQNIEAAVLIIIVEVTAHHVVEAEVEVGAEVTRVLRGHSIVMIDHPQEDDDTIFHERDGESIVYWN